MAILRVISRRLVLQQEASFVKTALLRGIGRFVVVLFRSPQRGRTGALQVSGALSRMICAYSVGAGDRRREAMFDLGS
jgi:hypothetical protein